MHIMSVRRVDVRGASEEVVPRPSAHCSLSLTHSGTGLGLVGTPGHGRGLG